MLCPCRQSVEYTQDNLTEAIRRIPSTGSSLGDTNLLGTLRSIYNTPRPRGHTRQVWVQGHGGVEGQVSQGEREDTGVWVEGATQGMWWPQGNKKDTVGCGGMEKWVYIFGGFCP